MQLREAGALLLGQLQERRHAVRLVDRRKVTSEIYMLGFGSNFLSFLESGPVLGGGSERPGKACFGYKEPGYLQLLESY